MTKKILEIIRKGQQNNKEKQSHYDTLIILLLHLEDSKWCSADLRKTYYEAKQRIEKSKNVFRSKPWERKTKQPWIFQLSWKGGIWQMSKAVRSVKRMRKEKVFMISQNQGSCWGRLEMEVLFTRGREIPAAGLCKGKQNDGNKRR